MSDTRGLMPCSKCGVFPKLFLIMDNPIRKKVELRCPHCGCDVEERDVTKAVIAWNHYYGDKNEEKKKCMAIIEFSDHHYERVDQLYGSETGKIRFIVNGEVYLYDPGYFEDGFTSKCCGVRIYIRRANHTFLKYDEFMDNFYVTDNIIRLLTSETDEGIKELEYILQTTEEKREEENEMKDILELVGKIEELLLKSKFEWLMTYDSKSKAWNFQIKEK